MCTGLPKVRVVCPGRKPSLVGAWELDSKRGTAFISVTNRHSLADSQKISLPSSAWQVSWGGTPQRWPEVQGGKSRCWVEGQALSYSILTSRRPNPGPASSRSAQKTSRPPFRPLAGLSFPLGKMMPGECPAGP